MTREKLEMLSAMVDDELDLTSQEVLTDELLASPMLKGAWRRYNMIGEVLREEYGREVHGPARELAGAAWQHPPQPRSVVAKPRIRSWMPITATMVLTIVGTITVTNLLRESPSLSGRREIQDLVEQLPVAQLPVSAIADASIPDEDQVTMVRYEESVPMQHDERLDSYIVNFNEQRVNRGMPGVHPYVRIVGYETAR